MLIQTSEYSCIWLQLYLYMEIPRCELYLLLNISLEKNVFWVPMNCY